MELSAQHDSVADAMIELLLENQEDLVDYTQLKEWLLEGTMKPLAINRVTAEEIFNFPLFSPAMATALIAHRERFGPLIQISELLVVGFTPEQIKQLRPWLDFNLSSAEELRDFRRDIGSGTFQCIVNTRIKSGLEIPDSSVGDQWYQNIRLQYGVQGSFGIALNMEKDPGEMWWNRGPDFTGGHIYIENRRWLRKLVIGDHLIGFGQGLVTGSVMGMGKSALVLNTRRQNHGIRPYRGLNEYRFLRGIAATFGSDKNNITLSVSYSFFDANPTDDSLQYSLIQTGLHRTPSELNSRKNTHSNNAGIWYERRSRTGYFGFGSFLSRHDIWQTRPYWKYAAPEWGHRSFFHAFQAHNIGRVHVYSEAALCAENGSGSIVAGMLTSIARGFEWSLLYRKYDAGFESNYQTAFGNQAENETGFYAGFHWQMHRKVSLSHYTDIWNKNRSSYRFRAPLYLQEQFWQIDVGLAKNQTIIFRYSGKNLPDILSASVITDQLNVLRQHKFRMQLQSGLDRRYTITFRSEAGVLQYPSHRDFSSLVFVQLSKAGQFSFHMRYTIFSAGDYSNRLFAFENQLPYDFGTTSFYGRGYNVYFLTRCKITRALSTGMKLIWSDRILPDRTRNNGFEMRLQMGVLL